MGTIIAATSYGDTGYWVQRFAFPKNTILE